MWTAAGRGKPYLAWLGIQQLRDQEEPGPAAIARRLGIGRASVYRLLGKAAA